MKMLATVVLALLLIVNCSHARHEVDEDMLSQEEFWFKKSMIEKLVHLHKPEGADQETAEIFLKEAEEILDMQIPDDPELRDEILEGVAKELGQDEDSLLERTQRKPIPA